MIYLKQKPAFTMMELIFVIIVLGIITSVALPRLDADKKQEAADAILSDIRYTQQLALLDDMHENDSKWQRKFWRIVFSACSGGTGQYYMIGSKTSMGGSTNAFFSKSESAIDLANDKPMFWTNTSDCSNGGDSTVSDRIFITKKYGVTSVKALAGSGCSGAKHIAFDHLGRPHHGSFFTNSLIPNHRGYMKRACTFTFGMSDGTSFKIKIEPETGYAHKL